MPRPKGSRNKTPHELELEAKKLLKRAKLLRALQRSKRGK